jgi:DNA-binding beta-propeller fold protein YncE
MVTCCSDRTAVRTFAAVALACSVSLAACGKPAAHHAAEPATAPPAAVAPVGTVRAVGALAEGAVFDARTGLLAVAVRNPDRLVLIDGRTLAVRHFVPLPGHARHLQLMAPGGPVLVPAEDASRLVEVSLPAGRIAASVPVGKQPHDAAPAVGGRIAVGNEFSGTVSIVAGGQVQRTITGLVQPGGVVDAGVIDARPIEAVVDVHTYTVSTYDPSTGKRLARKGAGAGPTHGQLAGPNRLAVADTRGDAVLTFSVSPLRKTGRLALPGAPYGMATDPQTHTVWVTLTARNEVVGLDVTSAVPRVIARYPTVAQPDTVAVAPGSRTLWVVGSRDGQVQRITR